jgi:hypothetical protein
MYGLLIETVIDFAKRKYVYAIWEKVKKEAKIQSYSLVLINKIAKIFLIG